jgi:hypothetical protein
MVRKIYFCVSFFVPNSVCGPVVKGYDVYTKYIKILLFISNGRPTVGSLMAVYTLRPGLKPPQQ